MTDLEEKNPIDLYYDMREGRIKLAQKEMEEKSDAPRILCAYLALLRTMTLVFQNSHWKCQSPVFYGNHLLFERIYNDSAELTDAMAEKLIGLFGNDALNHAEQIELIAGFYKKYISDNHIENSLNISKDFVKAADDTYQRIKEMGNMTLGLDDMIMAQSSKVEEFVYLLNQAFGGTP
jgi:DNA-binding ferritin-like protein